MANLIRTAKSGSHELAAYNIRVEPQDAATFFGTPVLPDPVLAPAEVLKAARADQASSDDGYLFLHTLELAMAISPDEDSAVVDFMVALFRACGCTGVGRVARTRKEMPLLICGENRHTKTDVCIVNDNDEIRLLVQEDKRHMEGFDPEPQLIAEAIAALTANNRTRVRTLSLPPLHSKVMPGITLTGTTPTFYKIPVSIDLVTAVQGGVYPQQETVVRVHVPALPRPARRWSEGMTPLDNRRIILACYEAFKQFVNQ
ncbi:hypothetical protein ACEPAI_1821 [Sanghuangporus weigelae]